MNFEEALENIGTSSSDVEGVRKRVGKGVVRRPIPSGYVTTRYKKKKKKKDDEEDEQEEKNEGRRITRDMRPTYSKQWSRDFWPNASHKKVKDYEDEEDDNKDDEEELDELLMQLSGGLDHMYMDPFWGSKKKKRKRKKDDKKDSEENSEKDDDKDSEDVEEGIGGDRGGNIYVDPHYDKHAIEPFWRKGDHGYTHYPIDDIGDEEDDEEHDDDDEEYEYYPVDSEEDD